MDYKYYVVLTTRFDCSVYVKGCRTKTEALKELSRCLKEYDVTFYTIRKEHDYPMIGEESK